jgi:anti-sigma factor RsiW
MKLTNEEVRRLYQQQTARPAAGRAQCLSEEAMTRLAAGEMNRSERELMADHLAACSDCAEEYRLLRELEPWAARTASSAYGSEPVISSADRLISHRPGWSQRLIVRFSSSFPTYAAAAALLVISLASAAWITSLKRENAQLTARTTARMTARLNEQLAEQEQAASGRLAEARRQLDETTRRVEQQQTEIAELHRGIDDLSKPQVNVPITDLEEQGSRRNGPAEVQTVTVPAGANIFTLILHVSDKTPFPDYALEAIDGGGRRVTRVTKLRKSQLDTFTVALPLRLFSPGLYRLRLYGLRPGRSDHVAEYQVRLNYRKG